MAACRTVRLAAKTAAGSASATPAIPEFGGVAGKAVGEAGWVAERDQVPAGNLVGVDAEPVLGDAALEPGGKEAVVGAGQHLDRHAGPAPECARLPEDSIGWLAGRSGGRQDGQGPG